MFMKRKSNNSNNDTSEMILDEGNIKPDPFEQFHKWYRQAMRDNVQEPDVMALATVGISGQPSCRMVLLKSYDDHGLTFFTNYKS